MNQPIYQIFVGNHNVASNLAWKALSVEQQKALTEQENASREAVGAKGFMLFESAWVDEMHPWWGLIQFPDVKARIEHTRNLQKMGWLEITDAFSLLGIDTDGTGPQMPDFPNPFYRLWVIKSDPAARANYKRLSKEEEAELWRKHNEIEERSGACMVLRCKSYWANEEYWGFGISAFPSIEALEKNTDGLQELNWPMYISAFTLLGIHPEG